MAKPARSLGAIALSVLLHAIPVAVAPVFARSVPSPARDDWGGATVDIVTTGPPAESAAAAAPQTEEAAPQPSDEASAPKTAMAAAPAPQPLRPSVARASPARERDPADRTAAEARAEPPRAVEPQSATERQSAANAAPAKQPWEQLFAQGNARADSTQPPGGSFGAQATGAPVRNLAKAFTRAIPVATNADRTWAGLPLGSAGSVRVRITVDASQALVSAEPLDERLPLHMQRLVQRTESFLKSGRFAIAAAPESAGQETLRVDVTIASASAAGEDDFSLGFESPVLGKPGRAYFRAWGRHVEARVTIESSRALR